jgi:hypothetical protein
MSFSLILNLCLVSSSLTVDEPMGTEIMCPPLPQPATPGCIAPPDWGHPDPSIVGLSVSKERRRDYEAGARRGLPLPPPTRDQQVRQCSVAFDAVQAAQVLPAHRSPFYSAFTHRFSLRDCG